MARGVRSRRRRIGRPRKKTQYKKPLTEPVHGEKQPKIDDGPSDKTDHSYCLGSSDCVEGIKTDENDAAKFDTIGQDTTESNSQYGNIDTGNHYIACGSENATLNMEVVSDDSGGRITTSTTSNIDWSSQTQIKSDMTDSGKCETAEPICDYYVMLLLNMEREDAIRKMYLERNWDYNMKVLSSEELSMINLLRSEEGTEVLHAVRSLEQEPAGSVVEPAGSVVEPKTEFKEASIDPIQIKVEVNDWNEDNVHSRIDTERNKAKLCLNEESGKPVLEISENFSEDKNVRFEEKEDIKDASGIEPVEVKYDTENDYKDKDLEFVFENECLKKSGHENVVNQTKQYINDTEIAVLSDAETENDQVIEAECGNEDFDDNEVENDIDMEIGNPDDSVFMPYLSGQNENVKSNADIDESGIKTGSNQTNVQFELEENKVDTSSQISYGEANLDIIQNRLESVSEHQLVQKSKQIKDKAAMRKHVKPDVYLILKPISTSPKQPPVMYLTNIKSLSQHTSGKVGKLTNLSAGKNAHLKIRESVKTTKKNDPKIMKMEQKLINIKTEKNQVERPRPSASSVHTCRVCGKAFRYVTHLRYHSKKTGHVNSKLDYGQCEKCGKFFKSTGDKWKHDHLYHQEDGQAKCELCSASFKSDYSLRHHLKVCHTIDPKKCLICSKTFRNKYLLKRHMLRTHDAKRFWCRVCERFLVSDIKVHMRTQSHLKKSLGMPTVVDGNVIKLMNETVDSEGNSLVANKDTHLDNFENRDGVLSKSEMVVQEASFSTDEISNDRLHIISESLSTETSLPPGSFEDGLPTGETNATLEDDLESSHMITTDIDCEKEAAKLVNHSTANHKTCYPLTNVLNSATSMNKQEISSIGNTSKGLKNAPDNKCFVCQSNFSDIVLLTKHMKKEHPEAVETYMSYKCEICKQNFSHVYDLAKHKKEQHSSHRKTEIDKTKRPSFQCDTCGRCLSSKVSLDVHIATKHEYTGETYNCDKCKASFRHPESLKRHKAQYHSAKKPVTCDICNNVFVNDTLLRKHKTRHYRKYWCKVCNKQYPHSYVLKEHQRTNAHLKMLEKIERGENLPATEKFICDILCDKEIPSKTGLSLHKTKIHQAKQNDTLN